MSQDVRPLGNVASRILFENELVRVWEMTLGPGERSDRHRHDLPYLLCILEGSRLDAEIEGTGHVEIPVQPGSVFCVPRSPDNTSASVSAWAGVSARAAPPNGMGALMCCSRDECP